MICLTWYYHHLMIIIYKLHFNNADHIATKKLTLIDSSSSNLHPGLPDLITWLNYISAGSDWQVVTPWITWPWTIFFGHELWSPDRGDFYSNESDIQFAVQTITVIIVSWQWLTGRQLCDLWKKIVCLPTKHFLFFFSRKKMYVYQWKHIFANKCWIFKNNKIN